MADRILNATKTSTCMKKKNVALNTATIAALNIDINNGRTFCQPPKWYRQTDNAGNTIACSCLLRILTVALQNNERHFFTVGFRYADMYVLT